MRSYELRQLDNGQYFTLKPIEFPTEKQVYIRGEYVPSLKKYSCVKWCDVNDEKFFPGNKPVYIDLVF